MRADFLVVGSGIAGLSFALKTANHFPTSKVIIVTKADKKESNTKYAQGGIAVTLDSKNDSFDQHIKDTLKAGGGLCNKKVVKFVIQEGPERLSELIGWGAQFDKEKKDIYHLGKEGGHSTNRIIHHGDSTGLEIEKTLLKQVAKQPNIKILSHHFALDLITHISKKNSKKTSCCGAYVLNMKTNAIEKVVSKITLLATGGVGQVYESTTNPLIATGDGIAMAYRAGAEIKNMEFVQFHPTALYQANVSPSFLISEAVRGFGAHLRTPDGKRFMINYDPREELATRDVVARAIDKEIKKSENHFVYLDCRHISKKEFTKHFPTITKKCNSIGIDISKDMIPVAPAAHYLCGGIATDNKGNSNIDNLYACGECAYTGLHGANRLASNSLLEAVVFADRCYKDANKKIKNSSYYQYTPDWNNEKPISSKEKIIIKKNKKLLQSTMNNFAGIVRSKKNLQKAFKCLQVIDKETKQLYKNGVKSSQLFELRNLIDVACLIVQQSLKRKKNKGVFYNEDLR